MALKITEGSGAIRHVIYHFVLVVCSNSVSILHHFRDITSFTVYLTAYDLEMSFTFHMTIEITSHVCLRIGV